jgi:hypothetical protein
MHVSTGGPKSWRGRRQDCCFSTSNVWPAATQPLGDPTLSDAELLRRFLGEGDEAAFTALVERHGAMVWQVCISALGQREDAEDVFQATFLVLARKAGSVRNRRRGRGAAVGPGAVGLLAARDRHIARLPGCGRGRFHGSVTRR